LGIWERLLKAVDLGGRLRLIPVDKGPGIPDDAVAVALTPLNPEPGDGWDTFPTACRQLYRDALGSAHVYKADGTIRWGVRHG
jgi:hypothetical protein